LLVKIKFEKDKKSSSKIKFKNQFREINILKNQVQEEVLLSSPNHTFPISVFWLRPQFAAERGVACLLVN
jgi:hypothetical protein